VMRWRSTRGAATLCGPALRSSAVATELEPTQPGGAPLKLTVERQGRICDAVRAGVRPEVAAVYCGIGARTYYRWMKLGRGTDADPCYTEFVEAVELALAEWEARDVLI